MEYKEYIDKNSRGIYIAKKDERIFFMVISLQYLHGAHDVQKEAQASVYAQMLLAGCGTFSRTAFLDTVNQLGASVTVAAENSILTITLSCLDVHATKLQTLVKTMLHTPTFAQGEIKRVIQQVCNELIEYDEDAKSRSVDLFVNALVSKGDYRYTPHTTDLIKEVKKVTKRNLQSFHNATLEHTWTYTCAGNSKLEKKTLDFIRNTKAPFITASSHLASTTATHKTVIKKITKNVIELASIPSKQNIEINIGAELPCTQNDDEYYAFVFGLAVLGKWGGFAGRLMSTVREKEGLTYGIYAKAETVTRTSSGYWRIMTFFAPEKVIQGITSTLREIELIKQKGITQSEFERFHTILTTGEIMLQDSLLQNVTTIHALQTKDFTYAQIGERNKRIQSVTRKDVNKALKMYLDTSKLVISAAGPVLSKAKELKSL